MKQQGQNTDQLTAFKKYGCWLLRFSTVTAALCIATFVLASSNVAAADLSSQRGFASTQQAVDALIAAVQDDSDAELFAVLGPDSEPLISSGDRVADQNSRMRFLKAYNEKNNLEQQDEERTVLIIGASDYPFPIPIVRQSESWIFDTQSGIEEILNRRIGRNELHTIEVMLAYTEAQREYAWINRTGKGLEFAQKLTSSKGRKDGLYWPTGESDEESPLGPLIARATDEGYATGLDDDPPMPFHGYFFRILKAQGEHANGGAFDYLADGRMVLGFALIAYPAKYAASGIMTFIVNQEGVIYEKDLGVDTVAIAAEATVYDPDDSWHKHDEPAGL
jgi:hypothetical protein